MSRGLGLFSLGYGSRIYFGSVQFDGWLLLDFRLQVRLLFDRGYSLDLGEIHLDRGSFQVTDLGDIEVTTVVTSDGHHMGDGWLVTGQDDGQLLGDLHVSSERLVRFNMLAVLIGQQEVQLICTNPHLVGIIVWHGHHVFRSQGA